MHILNYIFKRLIIHLYCEILLQTKSSSLLSSGMHSQNVSYSSTSFKSYCVEPNSEGNVQQVRFMGHPILCIAFECIAIYAVV